MNEYRYFIADDNKTGTLICSNEIKGEDMLLTLSTFKMQRPLMIS